LEKTCIHFIHLPQKKAASEITIRHCSTMPCTAHRQQPPAHYPTDTASHRGLAPRVTMWSFLRHSPCNALRGRGTLCAVLENQTLFCRNQWLMFLRKMDGKAQA